jgi:hypothetical protein
MNVRGAYRGPRLLGATVEAEPPLQLLSHIAMSDLTVLFGPNASGKSTALRNLASMVRTFVPRPRPRYSFSVLYLELTPDQMDRVLKDRLLALSRGRSLHEDYLEAYSDGVAVLSGWADDDSYRSPANAGDTSPATLWREMLEQSTSVSRDAHWGLILDALTASTTVAIEPYSIDGMVLAHWCLPWSRGRLPPELLAAIDRCGLRLAPHSREDSPWDGDNWDHLTCPTAPVIAGPIGLIDPNLIPRRTSFLNRQAMLRGSCDNGLRVFCTLRDFCTFSP